MRETLYVSVDAAGREHAPGGRVEWRLPDGGGDPVTKRADGLVLRRPVALLEVLEERIFRVEPVGSAPALRDGTLLVREARLVARTRWDTETATCFALDCAEHCLQQSGLVSLPDGTPLERVIADARQVIADSSPDGGHNLGYLARLLAFHKLRRERAKLSELQLAELADDERRDLGAYDDPDYAGLLPITDSVLAAIEALRHHLEPRFVSAGGEAREAREQHRDEDRPGAMSLPSVFETPFGPVARGPRVLGFEPSWTAAREAARHARLAARDRRDRGGPSAQASERGWQADRLESILRS